MNDYYKLDSGVEVQVSVSSYKEAAPWAKGPIYWMAEASFWDTGADEPGDVMWAVWGEPTEQAARKRLNAWLRHQGVEVPELPVSPDPALAYLAWAKLTFKS